MSHAILDVSKVNIVNRPCVTGLPETIYVEYFGKLQEGQEFIIFRPKDNWDYDSFVCLVRPHGFLNFQQVKITKVVRYRDGGTTTVETELGKFYFPSPFLKETKPSMNGSEITIYERNP